MKDIAMLKDESYKQLEIMHEALNDKVEKNIAETLINRKSIHNLRGDVGNKINVHSQNISDLKELILENAHQIKATNTQVLSLANNQKEMEKVVNNNTTVMNQLKGGLKVFVWIVGSLGTILTIMKIIETL